MNLALLETYRTQSEPEKAATAMIAVQFFMKTREGSRLQGTPEKQRDSSKRQPEGQYAKGCSLRFGDDDKARTVSDLRGLEALGLEQSVQIFGMQCPRHRLFPQQILLKHQLRE